MDEILRMMRSFMRRVEKELEMEKELLRPMWDYNTRSLEPLCTISETEDEVIVTMDLPMVKKDDIRINATEDTLEVEAKLKQEMRFAHLRHVCGDVAFTCFRKIIKLPTKVIPEEAKARFRGGVLEIRLPKRIRRYRIKVE